MQVILRIRKKNGVCQITEEYSMIKQCKNSYFINNLMIGVIKL